MIQIFIEGKDTRLYFLPKQEEGVAQGFLNFSK